MPFEPVSRQVIGAAIQVHRHLGPGLLESAYQRCMAVELTHLGLPFEQQVPLPLDYRGHQIDVAYRLDLVVAGHVIVELKSVSEIAPIHRAQLLTYLRLTGMRVGLLLNFNAPTLREGLTRIVL